ncbi:hypothetical protein [Amycolatopsis panacis]|uniref:Uncharacterized protein n=1 Tax=Amycolatopsis panacis TaxID=2340917 RepID=A0A419I9U5_9PSEU|nr:hypothetical protein [Amycolatopsis panacis]RJQ89684.1 hypothetical protein D5S19_04370 [Amycolatopsis panacis]
MTALDDRLRQRREPVPVIRAAEYEWHDFVDRQSHLYRTVQIRGEWTPLLLPWCEEDQRYPLRHDRESVTDRVVRPVPGRTCEVCERRVVTATREALLAQGLIWMGVSRRGEA